MKYLAKILGIIAVAAPLAVLAQANWTVSVDEFGNGSYWNGVNTTLFYGQLMADPSGGTVQALVYTLPFNFQQIGDYDLWEPPTPVVEYSDVVRFWGNNKLIFYSDLGEGDPADLYGLPGNAVTPTVSLIESGYDGVYQAAVHQPISGEPGFVAGQPVIYTLVSEVPEPGTLFLAGLASAVLLIFRPRRS